MVWGARGCNAAIRPIYMAVGRDSSSRGRRVLYTFGYLCVEWTVGAALGIMVGGPALLAIATQIGTVAERACDGGGGGGSSGDDIDDAGGQQEEDKTCYDLSRIGEMGFATTALACGNLFGSCIGGPAVDRMAKWNRVVIAAALMNGISVGGAWHPSYHHATTRAKMN